MATGTPHVSVHMNEAQTKRLAQHVADLAVHAAAARTANRAKENLNAAGRIDTGALLAAIKIKRIEPAVYEVRADKPYARYQEFGTTGPIYPKRAKFLRFKPKGSSTFVFARKVRGITGVHFMEKALKALKVKDFLP